MVDFPFETSGADRTERPAVQNSGGDRALIPARACQDTVSPKYRGQVLWSIHDLEWRQAKAVWGPKVH